MSDETTSWDDEGALQAQLLHMQQEHGDLDSAIVALSQTTVVDQLQLRRLKKRKLMLKDQITVLENKLMPDIIA